LEDEEFSEAVELLLLPPILKQIAGFPNSLAHFFFHLTALLISSLPYFVCIFVWEEDRQENSLLKRKARVYIGWKRGIWI
jgi:hypothetical protein